MFELKSPAKGGASRGITSLALLLLLALQLFCCHSRVDAKQSEAEAQKTPSKEAVKVASTAPSVSSLAGPLRTNSSQTSAAPSTKRPEKKAISGKDLLKRKTARSVEGFGSNSPDKLKAPSDLTAAAGHKKKYVIVKKKPKKKKPKKIKMKVYEPKIKYKKMKVKVPVKKYKKKKIKGYLVEKKHHHHHF